jgi:hypothetical protein
MSEHNLIREHYWGLVMVGLTAVIALLLSILHVPMVVRLSLLAVAAVIFVTILSKAGRAAQR